MIRIILSILIAGIALAFGAAIMVTLLAAGICGLLVAIFLD